MIRMLKNTQGIHLGSGIKFYGFPRINLCEGSHITIGDRTVLCSDSLFTALSIDSNIKIATQCARARIEIGHDVGMSGGCIVSAKHISIGSETLLGANVLIMDTDFHPIFPENRRHSDDDSNIQTAPVLIGENVFVGARAIILRGVEVGRDSVIAAGAVVTSGKYPPGSIIAGNPARIIGTAYRE